MSPEDEARTAEPTEVEVLCELCPVCNANVTWRCTTPEFHEERIEKARERRDGG